MIFRVSLPGEIGALTRISKTAFDTDISVGNTEPAGRRSMTVPHGISA